MTLDWTAELSPVCGADMYVVTKVITRTRMLIAVAVKLLICLPHNARAPYYIPAVDAFPL